MSTATVKSVRDAMAEVTDHAAAIEVFGSDVTAQLATAGQRRRATRRGAPDPLHRAMLYLNPDGVLEWHLDAPTAVAAGGGRRAGGDFDIEAPDGELVDVFEFETLDANAVGAFLERVDARMNPSIAQPGRLWRLTPPTAAGGVPVAQRVTAPIQGKKRRLLIVHGTFSKSLALLEGMARAPGGDKFFKKVFDNYQEVLAFEHPTVSVSPVMNALDLRNDLLQAKGPLDIVAHSRGGLVVRWALEAFGLQADPVRAVLVGSPLGGTSLASPPRLKSTLSLLSNFGTALKMAGGVASAYVPLLLAPMAILKVATSVTGVVAKTPLLDGAIAMIPGLAAQSRVSNNPELLRLRSLAAVSQPRYFVVTSDFEPDSPGWKFWQWFRGKRIANVAADKIFPGANDLVVDTESMLDVPIGIAGRREFGRNPTVHHTNYFEQDKTLGFIASSFELT